MYSYSYSVRTINSFCGNMGFMNFNIQTILYFRTLVFLLTITPVYSYRVLSLNITSNITWLMSDLNVQPVRRFDYEFNIEFPSENCCPIFSVYKTHRDYVKLECFTDGAKGETVWLKNYIHSLVPKDNTGNLPYDGSVASCTEKENIIRCIGKFRIQDFEPKRRDFILGFLCGDLHSKNLSLDGLNYTILVSDERNVVTCEKVDHSTEAARRCGKYMDFATFPNVFGDYSVTRASFTFDAMMGTLEKRDILCHKYLEKGLCFALFPACTNVSLSTQDEYRSESVVSPCRDLCEEFEISCSKKLGQAFIDTLYCDYFRYKEHIDICYHQDVFCEEPDVIPNGGYNIIGGNSSFAVGTTIEYYCDRNYELDGLQNSTCLFSGGWSSTSKCTLTSSSINHSNLTLEESLIFIGIPCVIVSAILVFVFFSLKRRTFKKKLTT